MNKEINNPRKVKRYLSNIQRMIFIADLVWFQKKDFWSNEYSKGSWTEDIIQISFLKIFFKDIYTEMIQAKNFYCFKKNKKSSFVVDYIIDDYNSIYDTMGRNEEILEKLIYQMYILDIEIDKTEHQRLMEEINNGKMKVHEVPSYIFESMHMQGEINYNALNKVIDFLELIKKENSKYLCMFCLEILKNFSLNGYDLYNIKLYTTLKRVKKLIDDCMENNLIDENVLRELRNCKQEIVKKLIIKNNSNIRTLLTIFNYDKHNERLYKKIQNIDNIGMLYVKIKRINDEEKWIEFNEKKTVIENLLEYFNKMKSKLQDKEFTYIKTEALYFLKPILSMLEVVELFSKEVTKIQQKPDLKYIEFEKFDCLKQRLEKVKYVDYNEKELEDEKEQFEYLLYKIEEKNVMSNYSKKKQEELITLLKELYKILTQKIYAGSLNKGLENIDVHKKEPDEKWKYCKIRIYRIEKKFESHQKSDNI